MNPRIVAILLSLDVVLVAVVAYFTPLWVSIPVAVVVTSMILYRARTLGYFPTLR